MSLLWCSSRTELTCFLAGLPASTGNFSNHPVVPNMVHHVSGSPSQPLRMQQDQALLTQQHFMQPEHPLLLGQQLHQQPLSGLPGLGPSMAIPSPPLHVMHGQQQPLVGSSNIQHPQLAPQPLPGASQPSTSYARQEPAPASAQELNQQKVCRICHEVKSLADSHRNTVNAEGHNSMCKTCAAEYDKEKRRRRQRVHEPTLTEKECPHCKKVKAAEGFYRYSLSQDGLYNICKVCHADQAKARQDAKAGMCPPAEKVRLFYLILGTASGKFERHTFWHMLQSPFTQSLVATANINRLYSATCFTACSVAIWPGLALSCFA